jgi:hypothetical protein
VRRLDRRTNIITTVIAEKNGDDPASSSQLDGPADDIAFAADGRLFVFTNEFDRFTTERSPPVGFPSTVDSTVAYAVTILTLNTQGAVIDKAYVVIDLRIDRSTFTEGVLDGVDEDGNGVDDTFSREARNVLTTLSPCEPPDRVQERIAVTDDGRRLFYPTGRRVQQLQLPAPGVPAECTVIGADRCVLAGR